MTDYIDREILLQGENIRTREVWDGKTPDYNYITCVDVKSIKAQPSVDAVEVVRCKDWEYYSYGVCALIGTRWTEDCFCAWGER
jgi:hypothetical protein